MMFFVRIANQIEIFFRKKGLKFDKKNIIQSNNNDGSVVLKLYKGDDIFFSKGFIGRSKEEVQTEVRFMKHVSECGIHVPKLLQIDGGEVFVCSVDNIEVVFYVMTELVGDSVIDKMTYVNIASKIALLHNFNIKYKYPSLNCIEKNDCQRLESFMCTDRELVTNLTRYEELEDLVNKHIPSDEDYLIHADLFMGNIITRNGKFYGIIDFSDIRNGLLEDDFGKYLQNLLTAQLVDRGKAKEVVTIYSNERNGEVDHKEIYISCIYHILYNIKCLSDNGNNYFAFEKLRNRYKNAIDFCVMEYKRYE